jgi:hypothetical protein
MWRTCGPSWPGATSSRVPARGDRRTGRRPGRTEGP